MNREETIADIRMRQRWLDGEIAQYFDNDKGRWMDCVTQSNVGWNDPCNRLRIKPKSTTRPWVMAECPVGETVVSKDGSAECQIVEKNKSGCFLGAGQCHSTYINVLNDHKMKDGSPCGITESTE